MMLLNDIVTQYEMSIKHNQRRAQQARSSE
jgi:hypothetical protein